MAGAALLNSGQASIRGGAYPNNPVGGGDGGGGGGGGGSTTTSVTLSDVPTIFRQVVLQPGKDHYNVTETWRDLRTGRTEVLNTGTVLELGPVQIGNLDDFVEIFGTGIVYCGSHTSPDGIGVEQKFQFGKADTKDGTYSAYADISRASFATILGAITFRSKIAAGGAGGRQYADYMPATQVASTWEDMGFVTADVGKWIKIIVLHKKPSTEHPNIEQRYGWRLTLKVDSEVNKTVAVTVASPASVAAGGSYLPSLDDTPEGVEDDGLWNRRGLFVQEHIKQLADSTRAFTSYDLSTAFVNVDGKLIGNVNRPGNWLGLFLEDEHAADGVRRPTAASQNNEFGLNAANGHFERSNGTDWLEYDPFASGQPWENAYPYGAWSDRTYTTGVKDGRGFRVTMTGKLGLQVGENGNDWETRITADATITAASKVVISAESTPLTKVLTITVKTMDGGDDTPTIVAVVGALNSFQPGATLAGFLVTAGYIGPVTATDKLDSSDSGGVFAPGSIDFANGSTGTAGVPLTHLNYWAETKTELDASWSEVGQVGLDFAGADLHAVTMYTAPEDGGIEETIKIYRPPGYRQVVPIGRGDVRPTPSEATLGKLYLDYYRRTVTFDSEKPVAATVAEGTGTEYTDADFNGIQTAGHRVYAPGKVYYNSLTYSWHLSILDQVIFSGYVWATIFFDNLGTNAGLPNDKHWLGDWASADLAAQAIQGYSSTTRYYYRNTTTNKIEYLSAVTESIGQHIDFESSALGVVSPYANNPQIILWGLSADKRIDDALEGNMVRITTLGENAVLKWKLDASEILFGADAGMVDILTAAEAVAQAPLSDVISSIGSSARGSIFFKLTPGYWSMNGYSSVGSLESTLSILKVLTGVDPVIAQGHRSSRAVDPAGGNVGTPDNSNPAILNSPPVKIEASDVLYAVHGDEVGSETDTSSQYLQLVYHGGA